MLRRLAVLLLVPLFLGGCQTLLGSDAPPVDTPNKRLAALELSYQAALKTADALLNTGQVRGASASEMVRLLDSAAAAMGTARAAVRASGGDVGAALAAANAAVTALATWVAARQQKRGAGAPPSWPHYVQRLGWRLA